MDINQYKPEDAQALSDLLEVLAKRDGRYHSDAFRFVLLSFLTLRRQMAQEYGYLLGKDIILPIDYSDFMHWIKLHGWM